MQPKTENIMQVGAQKPYRAIGQRGTSLIEILVVLVILVIGILSLIRIFPAGLIGLRNAQYSTFADRLGQGTLESLKQNGGSLPDGIYVAGFDCNGNYVTDPDVSPTKLDAYPGPCKSNPAPRNAYNSDVNQARYISGETITVPAQHVINSTLFPPIHALDFGPIYLPNIDPTASAVAAQQFATFLSVAGTPWASQSGDSRTSPTPSIGRDPRSRPETYEDPNEELTEGVPGDLVDSRAAQIAFPTADYPQRMTLRIQIPSGIGAPISYLIHFVLPIKDTSVTYAEPPDTASNYNGGWIDFQKSPYNGYVTDVTDTNTGANITGGVPSGSWVAGSAVVTREFRCVNNVNGVDPFNGTSYTLPFSADPYEFALCTQNLPGNSGFSDANMGVLAFNPNASGGNGRAPLVAKVTYTTFDWHIIHEDRDVPEAGSGTLRLTLDNWKKLGDVVNDLGNPSSPGITYTGLIPTTTAASQRDVLILDTDTGQLINTDPATAVINSDDNPFDTTKIDVSYKNGRVTLPAAYGGDHVRVFYAGDADWAVAVQKASSVYQREPGDIIANLLNPDNVGYYAVYSANGVVRAYFPACDAGKTIEFDNMRATYSDGSQKQLPIDTDEISEAADTINNQVFIELPVPQNNGSATLSNIQISAVRGISLTTVVIWHQGAQWHTRRMTTLLTRTP